MKWRFAVFSSALFFTSAFFFAGALAAGVTLTVTVVNTHKEECFQYNQTQSFTMTNTDNTHASFSFPTNFSSQNYQLRSFSYDKSFFETTKPPPSGKNFVGKVYEFNFYAQCGGSQISSFQSPATISFKYSDSDVSGLDESAIAPYKRGESDSSWSLIAGAAIDASQNLVTFSASSFSNFALFSSPASSPTPAPAPAPAPTPSSGGGGGGGILAPPTGVIFSGRAYPLSKVVVLKDGQIAVSTIAGPNARFELSLTGLSAGNYIFAVYGEDGKGVKSNLFTFSITVTSGAIAKVSGIFLAPTIAVDKSEVKRGDDIAVFGQSAPGSVITIAVNSEEEIFVKTQADKDGVYLYNLDTSFLELGQHLAKSKAALGGEISAFSKAVGFAVGAKNVSAGPPARCPAKADLNSDCMVNLVDFSIAAYWYKRPISAEFALKEKERLNGDGKIDLIDFSITAFYWTG